MENKEYMSKSWSGTRKILEREMICESLRGRIQYFMTHYHGAPDNYGRFCVRVDGKEMVFANPYNQSKLFAYANRIQKERGIPRREWNGKDFLNDEENRKLEDEAAEVLINEGNMDIYQITYAIEQYLSMDVQDAIRSDHAVIRMFAVVDRRIGKRTLMSIVNQVEEQPKWLQFFYKLRLDVEGIR